ncbi:hypothetical protein MUK42_04632 [Musa troglodytarum]|uniref:RRM domain-containing protein n=1 Tax=Musa troglodytarum TaxID=320322 RepID=A0A9E7GBE9_9LILI|nr:hypothetical protein MUK42_04632 [Musa troglodytarum]
MAALRRGVTQFIRSTARFKDHGIHGNSNLNNCGLVPPFQLVSARGIVSKLFVGGLSFYTTEDSLSEAFSRFGQVIEAKIIMDKVSQRSKGFGFVTFASEDEAQKALSEMDGKDCVGHRGTNEIFIAASLLCIHPKPRPKSFRLHL